MNKILIIDDDRELCALMKRSVQSEHIEADFCNTGKEGLQKLKEQEYQLVVLDVMMPGMDGFETLEEIRKENSLPILMFTSKNDSISKVRGLRAGADDYLTKPFDMDELIARIASLIRRYTRFNQQAGAMQKLDYLKSLGVNAIELMPVQEFDGNDSWGYNPCFFFALDKAYGTKKMYKDFIDACHKAGMAVIFDVVYNHATGSMPFAKLYWNSANNKTAPNNPYFNVDAPHPYSVFHDFNHESPLVRKFVKRNLQFLLNEYHIDGFRFDLTKGFTQAASTESSASNYDKSRIEILKDYHAAIKEVKPEAYVILEHFCDSKEEKELAEDGMHLWRNMNNAYCQTAMGWNDDSAFDGLYESIPAWIGFMESHDEERAAYKQTQWGDEALKTDLTTRMRQLEVNASFFFTVPGPKMIWQFGEMGYDVSIEENGRTGKKPLHWEYLENKDRKALHDSYSRLIKLRNDNPELFTSTSQFSWEVGTSNWGQGRFITLSSTTKHMLVAGNFSKTDGAYTVTFPVTGKWYDYLTGDEVEVKDATQKMEIPAHSYRILTTFPCLN